MLKPAIDLARLYGEGHVYSGLAHPELGRWLPRDPDVVKSLTGTQLGVLGRMPVVCAEGVADERGLDLLGEAGLEVAGERLVFRSVPEYEGILRDLERQKVRLVLQHRHPEWLLAPESYWFAPDLLSSLNDKGNLERFVSSRYLPQRRVFDSSMVEAWGHSGHDFPCVLKAGTPQSTGGGCGDVFICRGADDLVRARSGLAESERVIVEEWLSADSMYCLNYAVAEGMEVQYLGGAEMVCAEDGAYRGNWLGPGCEPGPASIEAGMETARIAAHLGYRGIFGLDLAESEGKVSKIFDLNFRFCGSTVGLLLMPAIQSRFGNCVGRFCGFSFKGSYPEAITSARRACRDGYFLPFSTYRPDVDIGRGGLPRVNGLILGNDRKEVKATEALMRNNGWQ
ncbi:hypothetical protein [Ferribacterium limneticum]|uniref:hypothetical protein n=1 Tax=Ferribacterium limneticum TaxID=76259 RepID=UPI001CFAEAE8|nr:hypothetical protein [Ferribacterium limneticum]UCV18271.1 hypothetical protein KI610_15915 [Ferribacterium limneticum]